MSLLCAALLACQPGAPEEPRPQPAPRTKSEPPQKAATPVDDGKAEEKPVDKAAAQQTPWTVTYSDGSGNGFRFWLAEGEEAARFQYSPVTPEMSSSGIYSGGAPKSGAVSDGRPVEELLQRVEALAADEQSHVKDRMKGTGAFTIEDAKGKREFIVKMGATLREFNDWVAPFRGK